jgi:hypothetical protein
LPRLAYLFTLYKEPEQFRQLFRAVYDRDATYIVHVDRKAPLDVHRGVAATVEGFANVITLRSQTVTWGGWSQVEVDLRAMRLLVSGNRPWDFLINLSGQDFPLKTQEEIREYLAQHAGRNFLAPQRLTEAPPTVMSRVTGLHFQLGNRPRRLPKLRRPFLRGVEPYWGTSWYVLARDFCEYVVSDPALRRYRAFFRHTCIPCESFFQTVLMNGPMRDTSAQSLRFVKWKDGKDNPEILTMGDLPEMLSSGCLFARKFDAAVNANVIDTLETQLHATVSEASEKGAVSCA